MYVCVGRYPAYMFFIGILVLQKHLKTKQHLEHLFHLNATYFSALYQIITDIQ